MTINKLVMCEEAIEELCKMCHINDGCPHNHCFPKYVLKECLKEYDSLHMIVNDYMKEKMREVEHDKGN